MTYNPFKIEKSPCTNCGKGLDGAGQVNGGSHPDPGDITICVYCGHIMAFSDDNMKLRDLTDKEASEVAGDPNILEAQRFAKEFRKFKAAVLGKEMEALSEVRQEKDI